MRGFSLATLLALLLLVGCGAATPAPAGSSTKLNVVTTVSPITNIVYNIGGDRISLTGIVPEGVNSHTFEPAPSDAKKLAQADLIIVNGLSLEEPTLKLAEANKQAGAEIILLGEQTITPEQYMYDFSFPRESGSPNPHLWTNPIYGLRYAEITRDALVRRDPPNADYYRQNFAAYKTRLEALDSAVKATIESIPAANRKLLTYHDSWAYFAPRYGMTVIGAIQPADFSEPSAREVAELITQLKQEQVPAIFGSEVFPSTILEQISQESGVKYIDQLRDDDLPGEPGQPSHSYIGLLVEDVRIMADNLGGDPALIATFDPTNIPGSDTAVQQQQ
jgi:ABC-type Zn uptake system ZnuABC Zn-binding protein ZnuA